MFIAYTNNHKYEKRKKLDTIINSTQVVVSCVIDIMLIYLIFWSKGNVSSKKNAFYTVGNGWA